MNKKERKAALENHIAKLVAQPIMEYMEKENIFNLKIKMSFSKNPVILNGVNSGDRLDNNIKVK